MIRTACDDVADCDGIMIMIQEVWEEINSKRSDKEINRKSSKDDDLAAIAFFVWYKCEYECFYFSYSFPFFVLVPTWWTKQIVETKTAMTAPYGKLQ